MRANLVEEVLSSCWLSAEVFIVNHALRLSWDDRCNCVIEPVHTRYKLAERVCKLITIESVLSETAKYLIFADVLKFIPII